MREDRYCASCANWFPEGADADALGTCRRHAPFPDVRSGEETGRAVWPLTHERDGCGDWYFGGQRKASAVAESAAASAESDGAQSTDDVGTFSWCELAVPNAAGAKAFYAALFDWQLQDDNSLGSTPYTLIRAGGREIGGIMDLPQGVPGQPARWTPYVTVADVDSLVAQAANLGARILLEPRSIPGVGRLALFEDPQGAVLAVIRYASEE